MTFYDVTMLITPSMQVYKNKPEKVPVFDQAATHDKQGVYETMLHMNLHTGTHMDFSLHMLKDGETSHHFDINRLMRDVKLFDLTHIKDGITKQDLIQFDIKENDFILLKTQNSYEETFNFKFIYLEASGSQYLKEKGVSGVGIDALGVERDQVGYPTHHAMFDIGAIIIEGLRLKDVKEGKYFMIALPMKLEKVEALPLRVLLYEKNDIQIGNLT